MNTSANTIGLRALLVTALPLGLLLTGCPTTTGTIDPQVQYDAGFAVGFAKDDEYWQGFDDSYNTVDGGDILYTGDLISALDEVSYDAGYYDGTWYAYNDGYFVAYDYAFTIGFSEGYDVAFQADWPTFLQTDQHVEWLDGGFTDGYNDGFSEGRILGASDYQDGLPFDWLDALIWYQGTDANGNPNDIYFPSLDLGTGVYGPVELYQYGTNPFDLVQGAKSRSLLRRGRDHVPTIRGKSATKQSSDLPALSYRALTTTVQTEFNVDPATSPRGDAKLTLTSTWLDRINAYNAAYGKKLVRHRNAVQK